MNEHKRIMAAQLLACGDLTMKEIQEEVGISDSTLWRWRREPEFIQMVQTEVRSRFAEEIGAAYNNLVKLAYTADSENVRLKATEDILDRGGIGAKQEIELSGSNEITVEFFNGEQQ